MTREEIVGGLTGIFDTLRDIGLIKPQSTTEACLEGAIAALRGPVPDPDTGLVPCGWCGPERIGWFSVQFWVRGSTGKRKWMSVTQDWKKKVRYCPMCGKHLTPTLHNPESESEEVNHV